MNTSCEQSQVKLETGDSLQRIFNAAWEHFIVKDNPPAGHYNGCEYLTKDGRKCAIGLCIPDGHPAQKSSESFGDIVCRFRDLFPDLLLFINDKNINDEGINYLDMFQKSLHDGLQKNGEWCFTKDQRKEKYLAVAREYGLTVPEHSS